jgi:predicted dithiol-disulfide oxidoreductase (DUF899 family)
LERRGGKALTQQKVGSREEWATARNELLEREDELNRLSNELAEQRRELPWVRVDKEYSFDTDEGTKTLAELFEGRSQLLFYNIMLGRGERFRAVRHDEYEDAGTQP